MKCENCGKKLEYKNLYELILCLGKKKEHIKINLCTSCLFMHTETGDNK